MNGLHVYKKNNGETIISRKAYDQLIDNNNIAMKRGTNTRGDTEWIEMIIPSPIGIRLGYITYCQAEGMSRDSYWLPQKKYTSIEKITGTVAPYNGEISKDMKELLGAARDTAIDPEYCRFYEEALDLHSKLEDTVRTIEDRARREKIYELCGKNTDLEQRLLKCNQTQRR